LGWSWYLNFNVFFENKMKAAVARHILTNKESDV
jgi:hypothetical protein